MLFNIIHSIDDTCLYLDNIYRSALIVIRTIMLDVKML